MKSLEIISLGMGVQSTALYYQSSMGILPRADYAIFSDLGREGKGTYRYLEFLLKWQKENEGIPIVVRSEMNLYADLLNDEAKGLFVRIPAFTESESGSEGMLRRQCTSEYKIAVVDAAIRDLYGLKSGARRPKTNVWHGITLDEMSRMSIPIEAWKVNCYPFIGYAASKKNQGFKIDWGIKATRGEVENWYRKNNLPIPPKSSCIFCPYQSDYAWSRKKIEEPEDFADAVKIDNAIRNSKKKGVSNPIYLHRTLRPLSEIQFDETMNIEWGDCSGNCHV